MARPRKSRTENICVICGKSFAITANQLRKVTCSPECHTAELKQRGLGKKRPGIGGPKRKSKTHQICAVCNKEFRLTVDQAAENRKTCSDKCRAQYRSIARGGLGTATCEECGKQYQVSRYYIRQNRRFCSDECRLKWFSKIPPKGENSHCWRGGTSEFYGSTWKEARRKARDRDNHSCSECGKHRDTLGYEPIVHHIKPFKSFGIENHVKANHLDNLLCYCRSCHMKLEWKLHRRSAQT